MLFDIVEQHFNEGRTARLAASRVSDRLNRRGRGGAEGSHELVARLPDATAGRGRAAARAASTRDCWRGTRGAPHSPTAAPPWPTPPPGAPPSLRRVGSPP